MKPAYQRAAMAPGSTHPNSIRSSRRAFLSSLPVLAGAIQAGLELSAAEANPSQLTIQTVLGPIPARKLGRTLPHEHVMCDFIGAEQTGRHRWETKVVVKRMLPFLERLRECGFTGLVDCSPAYIGRDPRVLRELAQATGLHLITNTGYYGGAGDKYVPRHAYDETVDQLAARWIQEWEEGIENTRIKPGFMKIGVDEAKGEPAQLSPIDAKLVRASARASKRTGLSVTCHTGGGPAGLAAVRLFIEEGARPSKFIVAHSDGHGLHINQQVAKLGSWVSFDGIGRRPLDQHLKLVSAMVPDHVGRLLLSHDNGWFNVGQEDGGEIREFTYLSDTFLPALLKAGSSQATIDRLTIQNPAEAFGN